MVYISSPVEALLARSISEWVIWHCGLCRFSCVSQRPHTQGPVWAAWTQPIGPTLSGLGLELQPPRPLQTDVDPAHPSSLAQPLSIMGFAKQGASERNTVGWDAASHNSTYRLLLAPTPLQSQLETHVLGQNEMPFEISHVLTLHAPTYFANKETFFHMQKKEKRLLSFFFFFFLS